MNCSVCKTTVMTRISLDENLPAHACGLCGSIYLSSGEYWAWLEQHQCQSPGQPENIVPLIPVEYDQAKICPTCGHLLLRYKIGHEIDFMLDHCGQCNGVWFDKHEWNVLKRKQLHRQIHKMFGAAMATAGMAPRASNSMHGYSYP